MSSVGETFTVTFSSEFRMSVNLPVFEVKFEDNLDFHGINIGIHRFRSNALPQAGSDYCKFCQSHSLIVLIGNIVSLWKIESL